MPLIRKDAGAPRAPDNAVGEDGLKSLRSDVRWTTARRLARDPCAVDAMAAALAIEADPRVREALFTSLAHIRTPQAVAAILPHIRSEDAAIRAGALDALTAMPEAVESRLPALLADPDPDVRLLVCEIVRRLPGPSATRYLCELLNRETLANVCGAAVEALSEVGDESALPTLSGCAERFADEPFLVFSIKAAASRIAEGGRGRGAGAP